MNTEAILFSGVILAISGIAHSAVVVVDYQFAAVGALNPVTPQAATTTNSDVTSSTFVPYLNGAISASNNATSGMAFSSGSLNAYLGNGSIAAGSTSSPGNDYWEFTLTPGLGISIDYTTLVFDWIAPTWTAGNPNTVSWDVRTSADGYASTLGVKSASTSGLTSTQVGQSAFTADLSSLVTTSSALTFRIYNYKLNATAMSGAQMRVDNVVVNGTVIPEPSASLLLAAGLTGVALTRRRRLAE